MPMMELNRLGLTPIVVFNLIIWLFFTLAYFYQIVYIIRVMFKGTVRLPEAKKQHRYAFFISAHNEELVIGNLVRSIFAQDYPRELMDVFVVCDACTDGTHAAAEEAGAIVWDRNDLARRGKSWAMDYGFDRILNEYGDKYEAFIVMDADNLVSRDYIKVMNQAFDAGYLVCTGYRNSKNFDSSWISAAYALWFLRESQFLNHARMKLGTSCAVSGTGFLFSQKVLDECGGWNFFLLTEDIEFTVHNVVRGRKIGYCHTAVLYDEQPTAFRQSWRQRLRWARGYLQVFGKYGGRLLSGIAQGSFSCFDMTMNIMPAAVLSFIGIFSNGAAATIGLATGRDISVIGESLGSMLLNSYLTLLIIGGSATISEWKRIYTPNWKKLAFTLTFPLFMFTYIPISFAALFARRVTWKPIAHTRSASVAEIRAAAETLSGRIA